MTEAEKTAAKLKDRIDRWETYIVKPKNIDVPGLPDEAIHGNSLGGASRSTIAHGGDDTPVSGEAPAAAAVPVHGPAAPKAFATGQVTRLTRLTRLESGYDSKPAAAAQHYGMKIPTLSTVDSLYEAIQETPQPPLHSAVPEPDSRHRLSVTLFLLVLVITITGLAVLLNRV